MKAYLKEGRALRVETTINNPADFDLRKTLNAENWRLLRRQGTEINARFLAVLGDGNVDPPDPATLEQVVLPSVHDGQRAPGLRFGDPRTTALLASVRLRLKGFIERIPGTNTYRVTSHGLRVTAFLTHLAARVMVPTLTDLAALAKPRPPAATRPLTTAWRTYETELNHLLRDTRQVA